MLNFDVLQDLITNWYEVPAIELSAPESAVPPDLNPILKDFYLRFGALTLRKSQFTHPDSSCLPLSCQDQVVPLDELESQGNYTIFSVENQGNFVVAARNSSSDQNTYVEGDAYLEEPLRDFSDVGVPLQESLVTCVLRETILSVGDRYRRITPEGLEMDRLAAQTGQTVRSRYIWSDSYGTFHLSNDVWFMDMDGYQCSAHRGLWRQPPCPSQEIVVRRETSTN